LRDEPSNQSLDDVVDACLGGLRARQQIGHERYYGYIACTRPSERLLVSFSQRDAEGRAINPSPFIAHLQRLFPSLEVQIPATEYEWREAEHINELAPALAGGGWWNAQGETRTCGDERRASPSESPVPVASSSQGVSPAAPLEIESGSVSPARPLPFAARLAPPVSLFELCPSARELAGQLRHLSVADGGTHLSAELAAALYGPVLRTSVSRIEQFAACPFKFFVASGLRAEERKRFELDARERGSFQHEVLRVFHEELAGQGLRWREVTPTEARERIGRIAGRVAAAYGEGLLTADDASRFTARSLAAGLQDFIEVIVGWMRAGYTFDPARVELAFGKDGDPLPAWEIDLGGGRRMAFRGKIDRVDVARNGDQAWVVVVDYKSGGKQIDRQLLEAGVQIQLPAYLAALCRVADAAALGVEGGLAPAGLCYVSLRGSFKRGGNRADALQAAPLERLAAGYKHEAWLNFDALRWLDADGRGQEPGWQFKYRKLTQAGKMHGSEATLKTGDEFRGLMAGVERTLREIGRGIYAGETAVAPFRQGSLKACDHCDYRAICRFDPWTQPYRALRPVTGREVTDDPA